MQFISTCFLVSICKKKRSNDGCCHHHVFFCSHKLFARGDESVCSMCCCSFSFSVSCSREYSDSSRACGRCVSRDGLLKAPILPDGRFYVDNMLTWKSLGIFDPAVLGLNLIERSNCISLTQPRADSTRVVRCLSYSYGWLPLLWELPTDCSALVRDSSSKEFTW